MEMLNFRKVLGLLWFVVSTFGLYYTTDEDFLIPETSETPTVCPEQQIDVSLSLSNVGLTRLPDEFIKSQFLTHLTLDNNEIATLKPKNFLHLPSLTYLSLANNKLSKISLAPFSKLQNLTTLILNGNCKPRPILKQNRYSFGHRSNYYNNYEDTTIMAPVIDYDTCALDFDYYIYLPDLKHLYVENNNIGKFSGMHVEFPALTHLYMANNMLSRIMESVADLSEIAPNLKHLDLKNSSIIEFDVSKLLTITYLYLDNNAIHAICNEYGDSPSLKLTGAQNLKTLSVSHNEISKIDIDSFNYTIDLRMLDLSYNRISEIREGTFDKLHELRNLSLEHNMLTQLSVHVFRGLSKLERLSLAGNVLSRIPSQLFAKTRALQQLMLNATGISRIYPGTFKNLTNLEVLSLADNKLDRIPEESLPSSLVVLTLERNRFTGMAYISLGNARHLKILVLRDNPLEFMSLQWFSNLSPELTIILGNNCHSRPDETFIDPIAMLSNPIEDYAPTEGPYYE